MAQLAPRAGPSLDPLARHLLVELRGCPVSRLADEGCLARALSAALGTIEGRVVAQPFVVTGAGTLAGFAMTEHAHLSLCAWPMEGIAAADVFGAPSVDLARCVDVLVGELRASSHLVLELGRGIREGGG